MYHTIPKPRQPLKRVYSTAVAAVDRFVLARWYPDSRPVLSCELRARLWKYYRDDVEDLETLMGRSLDPWRP